MGTDALWTVLLIGGAIWLIWATFDTLNKRRLWKCSECGFECYGYHEILGHQKYHQIMHNPYQD